LLSSTTSGKEITRSKRQRCFNYCLTRDTLPRGQYEECQDGTRQEHGCRHCAETGADEMTTMRRASLWRASLNMKMRRGRGQGVKALKTIAKTETDAQLLLGFTTKQSRVKRPYDRVEGGHYPYCNVQSTSLRPRRRARARVTNNVRLDGVD
jgi:hypothetical protein